MDNTHTLKGLQSQVARLEADLLTCKSILREKNAECETITKNIKRIKGLIKSLTESPDLIISEHAILRYLERVNGINLEDIKNEILTESFKKVVETLGEGKIPLDNHPGIIAIVKGNTITTIIQDDK